MTVYGVTSLEYIHNNPYKEYLVKNGASRVLFYRFYNSDYQGNLKVLRTNDPIPTVMAHGENTDYLIAFLRPI